MSIVIKPGTVQRDDCMEISRMHIEDVCGVYNLERECFTLPWSKKSIESELSNPLSNFFVAKVDNNVVGYIGTQTVLDECYITNIAVTKSVRKSGIGSALIKTVVEFAQDNGASFITLEVRKSNENAISLYNKFGFSTKGIRKNFYEHPVEDGIIMTKMFQKEGEAN